MLAILREQLETTECSVSAALGRRRIVPQAHQGAGKFGSSQCCNGSIKTEDHQFPVGVRRSSRSFFTRKPRSGGCLRCRGD